jgi:hypothetical protein
MRLLKNPDYDIVTATRGTRANIQADIQDLLSDAGSGFTNFFVTSVSTSYSEKTQIMTTFGDNEVVYYFGKQPIIFNISGLLFDSMENDWFVNFLTLYATTLRGTQLAQTFGLVEITFPNMIVTGSISQLSTQHDAHRDTDIVFSMQFIAKDVVPLPSMVSRTDATANESNMINFSAGRKGVVKYTLASGTSAGGFMNSQTTIGENVNTSTAGGTGASESLNSFRTNIFSPVFGVIASITKVVKTSTGSVSTIISSFTNPVNQVLRDITNIATQASGVAILVQTSVLKATSAPGQVLINLRNTIAALKGSAGIISRMPQNISDNFRSYNSGGYVKKGSTILTAGKAKNKSKTAVLSSGNTYNPSKSNTL